MAGPMWRSVPLVVCCEITVSSMHPLLLLARRSHVSRALLALLTSVLFVQAGVASVPAQAASLHPSRLSVREVLDQDWSASQWALDAVHARQAWATSTGSGVLVAVLDTGVDGGHPALAGQLRAGVTVTASRSGGWVVREVAAGESRDGDGHGTHVAGIIAANGTQHGLSGVAPGANILPVNVAEPLASDDPAASLDGVGVGIRAAVSRGAQVISMSLGGPTPEQRSPGTGDGSLDSYRAAVTRLCRSVAYATGHGVVVVAAAGNDGDAGNYRSSPAACPGVIAVAASDVTNQRATFSSYDPAVTITAPGVDVLSSVPVWSDPVFPYAEMSGTSMATPVVSGVVALYLSVHPGSSVEQVRQALTASASDLGPSGTDPLFGAGLVNAAAMLGLPSTHAVPVHLSSSVRTAVSDDPNLFVTSWLPPTTTAVASYRTRVFDRSGRFLTSVDGDGSAVRALFTVPESSRQGFWVATTATLADGRVLTSVPVHAKGLPSAITGVHFVRHAESMTVSWSGLTSQDAQTIVVNVVGPHTPDGVATPVSPGPDGRFPSSVTVALPPVPAGQVRSDADITVSVYTANDYADPFSTTMSDLVSTTVNASQPATLTHLRADGANSALTGYLSATAAARLCPDRCGAASATVSVQVLAPVPVRSGKGWRTSSRWVTSTYVRTLTYNDNPLLAPIGWSFRVDGVSLPAGSRQARASVAMTSGPRSLRSRTYLVYDASWPVPADPMLTLIG
jgi:hypothetical protein